MQYKLIKDGTGNIVNVKCVDKNMFIPINKDNTDYQQYLKWLEEGNTPEPAEETI
jgi:hypothetical protein